jgi:hypothetical protein
MFRMKGNLISQNRRLDLSELRVSQVAFGMEWAAVVTVNCALRVVKQTFGWQPTQIFPNRDLGFSQIP